MSKAVIIDRARIEVPIPLTTTSGKIRAKNRSTIFEYGLPFASRQNNFLQSNYIEWQIGYDVVIDDPDKLRETNLPEKIFVGYNSKRKALYELSEYLYYFVKWQFIRKDVLLSIAEKIRAIPKPCLVENHSECQIKRTHPRETSINDVSFYQSKIEYPLLIHRFGIYEIIAEIVVREKQRAIGTQAMLYFCFPINELRTEVPLIGRKAERKESGRFIINRDNCGIFLEMIGIFGMLSVSHRFDVLAILDLLNAET